MLFISPVNIITMNVPDKYKKHPFSRLLHTLAKTNKRFVINYGGTAAGKSFSAAQKEIICADMHPIKTLVIRKVGNTLRDSVIPSFLSRIRELELEEKFKFNKTDRIITHKENGSEIVFRGLDDPDKLKSFEGLTRILVEEAAELTLEDFMELNRRARGRENIQITLTFNPIDENHWLKKHFFDREDPDVEIIHSTYKDNDFLTEQDKQQIENISLFNNNQYRIYALGEWGILTNEQPWLFSFERDRHTVERLPLLSSFPVYLSFDFNIDPLTCVAAQMSFHQGAHDSFIHFIREFSAKCSLEDLCRQIKMTFPGHTLFVTGDASGNRHDLAMNDNNATYYSIIQSYLDLSRGQMNLHRRNLPHGESYMLINSIISSYPRLLFSREGCPLLINDCTTARIDINSRINGALRKDREAFKMDLFDCMRYFFQQYFQGYSSKIPMGKMAA